jgi:glycosyltransferase involved in cell wall biosynthesis
MKVLMISGDKRLLEESSEAHARLELQRGRVDQLDVFVWPQVHSVREIIKAAQANHYDVITVQDPFWRGLIAWRIARKTGAKLNLQVHTNLSAQSFYRRLMAYFLIRRADSVRVVSENIREQVQSVNVKIPILVLPIYVDISHFQFLIPKSHSQKTILWIGRFEREKDPSYAVRVLKKVRAKGIDAKLIMLGAGSFELALQRLAEKLPIELPGWQDPAPYLQIADVVLCTSRHESWGASMVEALAAGVLVVAPDVGVAREAGAIISKMSELGDAVIDVLNSNRRGKLKISILGADEWAKRWRETLI